MIGRFFGRKRTSPLEAGLGVILVKMGLVTQDKVDALLKEQAAAAEDKLGKLLVERGLITSSQLAKALELQQLMRKGRSGDAMMEMVEWKTKNLLARAVS